MLRLVLQSIISGSSKTLTSFLRMNSVWISQLLFRSFLSIFSAIIEMPFCSGRGAKRGRAGASRANHVYVGFVCCMRRVKVPRYLVCDSPEISCDIHILVARVSYFLGIFGDRSSRKFILLALFVDLSPRGRFCWISDENLWMWTNANCEVGGAEERGRP